ncbi:Acyl transferase/acyl hydrolase/lysophospholipase [Penicillium desertorum]|uniref:Acyl transferase/acyl hydrolase/lysophospholipase n=1 Tax=Penicillium desertorum TaxID=1303715 RepID=A0A9W9X9Q3_9EURO|nr:Acyl transferase/acyl hydrolase/lysophospholipase [Penicillium desertorum]
MSSYAVVTIMVKLARLCYKHVGIMSRGASDCGFWDGHYRLVKAINDYTTIFQGHLIAKAVRQDPLVFSLHLDLYATHINLHEAVIHEVEEQGLPKLVAAESRRCSTAAAFNIVGAIRHDHFTLQATFIGWPISMSLNALSRNVSNGSGTAPMGVVDYLRFLSAVLDQVEEPSGYWHTASAAAMAALPGLRTYGDGNDCEKHIYLALWLMKKGTRNFAFLSRSGADSVQASLFVDELRATGATVQVFRRDAGVKPDNEQIINSVPSKQPIRGVIHAAMVLRDGLFHNMPYENWKTSVHSKVTGTKNLHEVLSHFPLDFFVITSSVSGVLGNIGNTRTNVDCPSMVLGVGVVAENNELVESLRCQGIYGIDEEALLRVFEIAIIEQFREGISDNIVAGLDPIELTKSAQEAGEDVDSFWASEGLEVIEAVEAVPDHFIAKLACMLMLDMDEFEEDNRSIASYGVESMIGAELRN